MLNVYITEFQEGKGPLISGGKNQQKRNYTIFQLHGESIPGSFLH